MHRSQAEPLRDWMPEDEPGYSRIVLWPYLRRESKQFWAAVSRLEHAAGQVAGTLEGLAVVLGSNKTSVRDHARRLESLGLMAVEVAADGQWQLRVRVPELGEIPSAAEARAASGRTLPKRVRYQASPTRTPQRSLPFDDGPVILNLVLPDSPDDPVAEREPVPDATQNGNPFPFRDETRSRSVPEREPVPVPSPPEMAGPPGESGGETPRAAPSPQSSILKEKESIRNQSSKNSKQFKAIQSNQPSAAEARTDAAAFFGASDRVEAVWAGLVRGDLQVQDVPRDEALAAIAAHCRAVVLDPKTDAILFERAARLVVDFGLYVRDLHHVLERIAESRRAGRFKNGGSPGAIFNANCEDLARQAGVDLWTGKPKRGRPKPRAP